MSYKPWCIVLFLLQFGHTLQQLLSTVPYSEVAGQRYVEWDSQHTCANVMSMLLLHPNTLSNLGQHFQTDKPIPDSLVADMLKGCDFVVNYCFFMITVIKFCLCFDNVIG